MEFETGDHVVKHPFGWYGTVEVDPRFPYSHKIILDKPHHHFRDAVLSSPDELQLVRDYEVEQAERSIKELKRDLDHSNEMARYYRDLAKQQRADLREERAELKRAKSIPRKSGAIHA